MKTKINLLKTFLNLKVGLENFGVFDGKKVFCWCDGFYISVPFESGLDKIFATNLKEFVRVADGKENLDFELHEESETVKIKFKRTRFKIPSVPLENTQEELDLSDAKSIDFANSNIFLDNLKKSEKFMATKDIRAYLEGVSIKGSEMGASNGCIAILIKDCGLDIGQNIVIPRVAVEFLTKIKLTLKTIFVSEVNGKANRISFQFENGEIFSSPLIDQSFPDLSSAVFINEKLPVNELPQTEFFDALRELKAQDKGVGVRLSPTQIEIQENVVNGTVEATVEIDLPGMIEDVGFRLEYLLTLENLSPKLFYTQEEVDSVLTAFSEDKNLLVALMPVRL